MICHDERLLLHCDRVHGRVCSLFLKQNYFIMLYKEKNASASRIIILLLVIINVLIVKAAFIQNENLYWALVITFPLLLIAAARDVLQKKQAFLRNDPVTGHIRNFFERIRQESRLWRRPVETEETNAPAEISLPELNIKP